MKLDLNRYAIEMVQDRQTKHILKLQQQACHLSEQLRTYVQTLQSERSELEFYHQQNL